LGVEVTMVARTVEAVARWVARNQDYLTRMDKVLEGVDVERLNRVPDSKTWSPAQVVDHMVIANAPYLKAMPEALTRAPKGDSEVRHSFFGRVIVKGAGPGGNAPVIKKLRPRETRIPIEIVEEWRGQQEQIISLIESAQGKDISRTPVPNPFFPIFRMNLADCFEILTVHTERHLLQIEQRLR
jgi:hypothetical protein